MAILRKEAALLRWKNCEIIASYFEGVSKNDVYTYLYTEIKKEGLLEKALIGDEEALKKVMELRGWEKISESIARKDSNDVITPSDKIRVAMWFINKIGHPDEALRVLKAAIVATKALETK